MNFKPIASLQAHLHTSLANNLVDATQNSRNYFQAILDNFSSVDVNEAGLILKCIFYPFLVKALDLKNEEVTFRMINLLVWWLKKRPAQAPDSQIFTTLLEKRIYKLDFLSVNDCLSQKSKLVIASKSSPSLDYILELFNMKVNGKDCDDLIFLVKWLLTKDSTLDNLTFTNNLEGVWRLYLNPLTISQAFALDGIQIEKAIGKNDLNSTDKSLKMPVNITWSDGRYDSVSSASYSRERIDGIVEGVFRSTSVEKSLSLLGNLEHVSYTESRSREHMSIDFLQSKFISLIELVMSVDFVLLDKLVDILEGNFASLLKDVTFISKIIALNSQCPSMSQVKKIDDFTKQYNSLISEENLFANMETTRSHLGNTEKANEYEHILNMYHANLTELVKRESKLIKTMSIEWIKAFLVQNSGFADKMLMIVSEMNALVPELVIRAFLSFFLSTQNSFYLEFLRDCSTNDSIQLAKKFIDKKDVRLMYASFLLILKAEVLNTAHLKFLLKLMMQSLNRILENSDLVALFATSSEFLRATLNLIQNEENWQSKIKYQLINKMTLSYSAK